MTLFKTIRIGLYRDDLLKKKLPIDKITINSFKKTRFSLEDIEQTESIVFYDDDGQQLILKHSK